MTTPATAVGRRRRRTRIWISLSLADVGSLGLQASPLPLGSRMILDLILSPLDDDSAGSGKAGQIYH